MNMTIFLNQISFLDFKHTTKSDYAVFEIVPISHLLYSLGSCYSLLPVKILYVDYNGSSQGEVIKRDYFVLLIHVDADP